VSAAARVHGRWRDDVRRGDVAGLFLDGYLVAARVALPLALRSFAMDAVLRSLVATTPRSRPERARVAVARSEALSGRLGVPCTCLYRAMTRWSALRRAGLEASFVMGVRRHEPDVGHAWVEVDGTAVDEVIDGRWMVTFRYPPARPSPVTLP
jgi:hypothetical protein